MGGYPTTYVPPASQGTDKIEARVPTKGWSPFVFMQPDRDTGIFPIAHIPAEFASRNPTPALAPGGLRVDEQQGGDLLLRYYYLFDLPRNKQQQKRKRTCMKTSGTKPSNSKSTTVLRPSPKTQCINMTLITVNITKLRRRRKY